MKRETALLHMARLVVGAHADDAVLRQSVLSRFDAAPAHIARQLLIALALLDSRAANLLVAGRFTSLARLSAAEGTAAFERWLTSRLAPARSVAHGVRRFILASYYAFPEAQRALGALAAPHRREPQHSWEGPLPGTPSPDEPVARGSTPPPPPLPASSAVRPGITSAAGWSGTHYFRCDAVVIGSGAGGAVAAARLAEGGRDVLLLERGRAFRDDEFTEAEHELTGELYADRGLRTTDDQALTLFQGAALGGGTTVNWMLMLRTPDHVLQEWAAEHGTEGMSPAEMRAVFERVERETHATLVPDDAHSPSNRMLLAGAAALGWRARAARVNALGCVRAGTCSLGCRYGAKRSTPRTYLPRAVAAGARVLTGTTVERIAVTGRDRGGATPVQKRVYARAGDAEILVDAPLVVLAAGAVETPLILLRSGLGGPAVGRYLRLHPTTAVLARMPHETYPLGGIPQTALCDQFADVSGGYGFWIECPALLPGVAAAAVSGVGEAHLARVRQLPRLAPLIALVRDGSARRGSNGSVSLRRGGGAHISYRLAAEDARQLRDAIVAAARLALAGGATEVTTLHTRPLVLRSEHDLPAAAAASVAPNDVTLYSAHVNGTCRMGRDRRHAVVRPDGQLFDVRGVYVVDGSVLPTAPGVNPQETIYALATVLMERL